MKFLAGDDSTLVVLTAFRRPANTWRIAEAIHEQTVKPAAVVLMDNSGENHQPPAGLFDAVFSCDVNLGPPCRFVPALANYDCAYTLFLDDDLLPGHRCIEHFLKTAKQLNNRFATIGEIGRIFRRLTEGHWLYRQRNVRRDEASPTPIDMECRAHFVQTRHIRHAISLRWDIADRFAGMGDEIAAQVRSELFIHDDLLLCLGVQRATGLRSYITPIGPPETSICFRELPDNNAVSRRPEHRAERSRFIERAEWVGWKSPIRQEVGDSVPPYVDPPVVVLSDLPAVERMRYATAAKPLFPPDGRAAAEGSRP